MSRLSHFITNPEQLVAKSTVLITVNVDTQLEIPITSKGVLEFREELHSTRPIAPKKAIVIKADSDIGRELELTEDTVKLVVDEADDNYKNKLEEFTTDFIWQIAIKGIDMDFTDTKNKKITDFEGRRAVLLLNGITIEHLNTIFNAILKLGEAQTLELDEYIQKSIGLTKAVKRKIISRSKKGKGSKVGELYNTTRVMEAYKISPKEWDELPAGDKTALNYSLLMKYHLEAENMEAQERAQKLESNKQKVLGGLPTFSR